MVWIAPVQAMLSALRSFVGRVDQAVALSLNDRLSGWYLHMDQK